MSQLSSPKIRKQLRERFEDMSCFYCGSRPVREPNARSRGRLPETIDHIVPRSLGGRNIIDNILPSCRTCNRAKNDMTLDEFRVSGYFAEHCQNGRAIAAYIRTKIPKLAVVYLIPGGGDGDYSAAVPIGTVVYDVMRGGLSRKDKHRGMRIFTKESDASGFA